MVQSGARGFSVIAELLDEKETDISAIDRRKLL